MIGYPLNWNYIKPTIHIRGLQVMSDIYLTLIYGVKSICLCEQVKRNSNILPSYSIFLLDENEIEFMVS